MKTTIKLLLLTFSITFFSCDKIQDRDYEFTYSTIVTEKPVNLEKLNTSFDDYNSTLPYPSERQGIYFSTNRNSQGKHYDIIYKTMDVSYHKKDDVLDINFETEENYGYSKKVLETINTPHDEFGPYYHFGNEKYEYFFFANNEAGNFDIKYAASRKDAFGTYKADEVINNPEAFTSINSDADDYYPCVFNDNQSLVFCSNRDTQYNIYETNFVENEINPDHKAETTHEIKKNDILSSAQNDKCPYVFGDTMIFTSDREGGFGGFDLYYSKYKNGQWSTPQNLGPEINSAYDEYRPIIIPFYKFNETVIIFSSNRPGGKGGFDLYSSRTAQIPKPKIG